MNKSKLSSRGQTVISIMKAEKTAANTNIAVGIIIIIYYYYYYK
jgi:hypothetical protein